MKFDFNKLNYYRKIIEEVGTKELVIHDVVFSINDGCFSLYKNKNDKALIRSDKSFEVFKKKVASYYLNF